MGLQDNLLGLAYTRENLYLDLQEVEFGTTAWIFFHSMCLQLGR